jgi:hypothetical protein
MHVSAASSVDSPRPNATSTASCKGPCCVLRTLSSAQNCLLCLACPVLLLLLQVIIKAGTCWG